MKEDAWNDREKMTYHHMESISVSQKKGKLEGYAIETRRRRNLFSQTFSLLFAQSKCNTSLCQFETLWLTKGFKSDCKSYLLPDIFEEVKKENSLDD